MLKAIIINVGLGPYIQGRLKILIQMISSPKNGTCIVVNNNEKMYTGQI